jgi:hypothetical protein
MLQKDPIWLQATEDALHAFAYGDIIPHDWLADHLGIEYPDKPMTLKAYRERDFDLLRKVELFKDELLTKHRWYLTNVRGEGYLIVKPKHQTKTAMGKLQRELRRSVTQAMSALVHINETALSLEESRENAESKAKLAALKTLHLRQLPEPGETP